ISGRTPLHRRVLVPRGAAALLAAGAFCLPLAGCAAAPVVATDLAKGEYPSSVEVSVEDADGVQVVIREITIQPGAGTGEHCHHGQLVGVVKQGTLTHYAPIYPSGVHEYHAGDAIVEGADYVHEGVNEGDVPVVLEVTYLIEADQPLAETDLSKCEQE
ncbi:MAG: cupin domain-containing protein, partial [Microbacteriaceae bacterium]|nr:cupin domain-containing protein [Microbacteriaceae bacterium]